MNINTPVNADNGYSIPELLDRIHDPDCTYDFETKTYVMEKNPICLSNEEHENFVEGLKDISIVIM